MLCRLSRLDPFGSSQLRESLKNIVSKFDVKSVKEMQKVKAPGVETHHLIEQRLWNSCKELKKLWQSVDDIPGANLSNPVHSKITRAWRRALKYRNQKGYIANPSPQDIIDAVYQVYQGEFQGFLKPLVEALELLL